MQNGTFFELSLCLSRGCLGNTIIFTLHLYRFLTSFPTLPKSWTMENDCSLTVAMPAQNPLFPSMFLQYVGPKPVLVS
jgi:hypothetical protein